MYSRIRRVLKDKGLYHLIKVLIDFFSRKVLLLSRDYLDYPLSVTVGPNKALKFKVAIFRIRCKYNLFFKRQRVLWLGRHIRFNALKISYIDPLKIKYNVRRFAGSSPFIQDGDWDQNKIIFRPKESVIHIFKHKLPASESIEYKTMKAAIDKRDWHNSRNCRSHEDLHAYFETLNDIYNDMIMGKYKPSTQVKARYQNTRRRFYPDEICVSIDRNGEYINERGGGHRLSIAQLLKIDNIPVVIIGMHYQYIISKENWNYLNQ